MRKHGAQPTGSWWAWVPVALLGSMLGGLGVLTYIAVDDPHFALEPNYYDKAVHWDRAQAAARASAATGLRASVEPLFESADGSVQVRVRLMDRDGRPVRGARVSLEAFPNAFASRVEQSALRELAPGVYAGRILRGTPGVWELRLEATRGSLRFLQVLRQDVAKGEAA